MGEACSAHRKINAYKILVGKSEGKKPLGRSRCRKDNIKTNLSKMVLGNVD
jgi:hypothetical protein